MLHQAHRFGGRTFYPLTPGVVVEQGDRITTTCVYTNPTDQVLIGGSPFTEEGWCFNFALHSPAGVLNCPLPGT